VATQINVRLNDTQEAELHALIELHAKGIIGRVTGSDIVRVALHEMHERQLGTRPTTKGRKAPV
jgi:hypothetical protein